MWPEESVRLITVIVLLFVTIPRVLNSTTTDAVETVVLLGRAVVCTFVVSTVQVVEGGVGCTIAESLAEPAVNET